LNVFVLSAIFFMMVSSLDMQKIAFRVFILSVVFLSLALAVPSSKIVRAVRTDEPPVLDGFVNEPQWKTAPAILDFTQSEPIEGALPTELTSVRILYDDRAVYIGVICYDARPEGIVRQLSRRDRSTEADWFSVLIDSYFDRKSAFSFTANVSGVQSDGVLTQEGAVYDVTWDAVWSVRTRVYSDGWSAEFEIPYNALRFAEKQEGEHLWGINFRRYISRKKEVDEWVMVPRGDVYKISKWGTLLGITKIQPPLHLTLAPYVAGSSSIETATPTQPRSTSNTVRAGLDLKYGIARNFTLDATVNPDFGQVEVDQAVLNLTVFETRYPEKRPFFVEGAQFFTFGSSYDYTPLPLFFSRRIGKRPSLSSSVASLSGVTVEKNPLETTILAAAKLSGRTAGGLSVGALSAVTQEEVATYRDSIGNHSQRTEPQGSYNVVRAKQEFEGGSWLGGIATMAARQYVRPAVSGGVDWNLQVARRTHSFDGYVAAANAWNGDAQRSGAAGRMMFSRISAEHWYYIGSYDFFSRNFSINDLGFFSRPHDHGGYVQVRYLEFAPTGPFLRYGVSIVPESRWNWDGVQTLSQIELSATGDFTNFWQVNITYDLKLPAFDDAERGIIGTYRRPAGIALSLLVRSDERKAVNGSWYTGYEFDTKKKSSFFMGPSLVVRPASWMELDPSLLYLRTRSEEAAVVSGGMVPAVNGSSLFADRDIDELDLELRGILTFTRTLTLQFYTQMLLARGKYVHYRRLMGDALFASDVPSALDYDFNQGTFNANVLLRWEFVPGSALYLVWTQSRAGDSGWYQTGFGSRFGEVFALPHEDVLFLKVSYWLPL
jgi:Domain of unknown function (DUF5916)